MYIISIIAAVAGNIELPSLNCEFKSYNTFEDAVAKVETEINERYQELHTLMVVILLVVVILNVDMYLVQWSDIILLLER